MKVALVFTIYCILLRFSATSSCIVSNPIKDHGEVDDGRELNVMKKYIRNQMGSQEYDADIQGKEASTQSKIKKGKTYTLSDVKLDSLKIKAHNIINITDSSVETNTSINNITDYSAPEK